MPTIVQTKVPIEIKTNMRVSLDINLKNDLNGMKQVLTLSSVVEEVLDGNCLLIQMPLFQGYHYPLPHDTLLLMIFIADADMYAAPAKFQERIERDGFIFAKMRRLGKLIPHQRRDCYRVPCSLPVTIERLWIKERELYPDRQPTEGKMIDFCDGGMLFFTDENIEAGEKITLTFDMGNTETVESIALRKERVEDGKYLFKIAAQFKNNDKAQKRRFYKYVVDMQQEERRRWTQAINQLYDPGKKAEYHGQSE